MAHGHVPLLESASLRIEAGERVCVIGRNGAGKSTLLQLIAGRQAPDRGHVRRERHVRISLLAQDVPLFSDRPVFGDTFYPGENGNTVWRTPER